MSPFIKFALLTSLLVMLMIALPPFTLILAVVWGASLVVGALYLSLYSLLGVAVINFLLIIALISWKSALTYLLFFGLPALLMSMGVQRGNGYYALQRIGIIAALVGVSLWLGGIYYSTGDLGINHLETELGQRVEESMQLYEESGLMEIYQQQGISQEELQEAMESLIASLARHLPAFYYLQAIMAVFFMLFLASFASQKRNLYRLIRRPFDQEIMPWQMVWIVIIGLALWLLGRDQMSTVYYTGSNILLVTVPIALYYGLASVIYKMKRYKQSTRRIATVILVILMLVFPVSAIIFLTVIGLFDSLLDYRRLRTKEE